MPNLLEGSRSHAPMVRALGERLLSRTTLLVAYVLAAVGATVSKLALGPSMHHGVQYAAFQNFAIYRNAFFHLIHHQNLYAAFVAEQWDFYKYSPTFALLMGPLAVLPYGWGVLAWNVLNALALYVAITAVPRLSDRAKAWVLWFALLSALVCLQNAQSNALVAGLMIGAWAAAERERPLAAALCVVVSVFIKLFGGIALLPCLLVRVGRRRLLAFTVMWGVLLAIIPALVVAPGQLAALYQGWYHLLQQDQATNLGLSLMGLVHAWLHIRVPGHYAMAVGGVVLALAVLYRSDARDNPRFRALALTSALIWAIIFNHMAESPTMVIAVTGVGLWYVLQPPSTANRVILAATFVFTCLWPTDVVPLALRQDPLLGYIRVVPCVVAWAKLQYDLVQFREAAPIPSRAALTPV